MNTIAAYIVSYPRGRRNGYEKEYLGEVEAPAEASSEDCFAIGREAFPRATHLSVSDEEHPCGWVSGSVW